MPPIVSVPQKLPFDKDLALAIADLDDVYGEATQAGQETIFDAAVKAGISEVGSAKSVDELIGKLGAGLGAAGGAAVCAATGAGAALAPICSAAGAWVGDKLGGVIKELTAQVGSWIFSTPSKTASVGAYNPDLTALKKKREAILAAIAQSGDDPEAISLIKELADQMAPLFPAYTKMPGWGQLQKTPMGLGYATLLAAPPFVIAPKAFEIVTNPSAAQLGDLDPYQGPGGFFFRYLGTLGWPSYVVASMVDPFVKAGLPVEWVKQQAQAEPLPVNEDSGDVDYWKLVAKVSALLMPELDKWVANRIRWILEESAIRRNARATLALKKAADRIKALHPNWSAKEVQQAQDTLQRVVRSDDPALVTQALKTLSEPDSKASDVTTTKEDPAQPEPETKPKKSGGGGMVIALIAVAGALYVATR